MKSSGTYGESSRTAAASFWLSSGTRARVVDRVHRVEAQAVDVIVADPAARAVDDPVAHLVAVGSVEVDGRSPRRPVAVGEVRAEVGQVVPLRTDVVVDDVEHDAEP